MEVTLVILAVLSLAYAVGSPASEKAKPATDGAPVTGRSAVGIHRVHLRVLSAELAAILTLAFQTAASATTYWVSPDGEDSNNGSAQSPWRTVQRAADTMGPGDVAIVREGIFDEHVVVSKGGSKEGGSLTIRSERQHGAKCRGFLITGDRVVVEGFDVEADMTTLTGIIVGSGKSAIIRDCDVHDCPMGGINVGQGASDALVAGNLIRRVGQWGLRIAGTRVLVEANDISGIVQHHPKGDPPGLSGHDADGLRVFGSGHVIRANRIHDIADPADTKHNIDPHADCIQTWDGPPSGAERVMTDSVIERNHFRIEHPSGKGIIMEAMRGNPCQGIIIRNNVFEFRDEGVAAAQGLFRDIRVYNNLFKANLRDRPWGVAMHMVNVMDYSVQNNILVDCHAESRLISGGTGIVDYNLVWNSDGSRPAGTPGRQPHELWGVDPLFANYRGKHGGDYHLRAGSPAIDAGSSTVGPGDDRDGVQRPQGIAHDIGAYEFVGVAPANPVHPHTSP